MTPRNSARLHRRVRLAATAVAAAALVSTAACNGDAENGADSPASPGTTTPTINPRDVDLRTATVTLPEWPGSELRDECPAGTYNFRDGQAPATGEWLYFISFLDGPTYGDIDGMPGEEILTPVGCGPPQSEASVAALALRPTGDKEVETMGYVQSGASFYAPVAGVQLADVLVTLRTRQGIGPDSPEHERTFRWENGTFVQQSGPTATPQG